MTHHDPTNPGASVAESESATEQARLDDAIQRADELLVNSLKAEDRRRNRRKPWFMLFTFLGGLGMAVAITTLLIVLSAPPAQDDSAAAEETAATQVQPAKRATSEDRRNSAALSQAGWQLWRQGQQQGQFAQAIEKFTAAVELDPRNTNAWNGLGWANFTSGNSEEAEKAFQRVIRMEPQHPAALNGLGQIAFLHRKYDVARRYLHKAAPQAPAAWYALAKIYLLEGNYAEARKWIQKIIAGGSTDPTIKELLAAAEAKELSDRLRRVIEPPERSDSPEGNQVGRAWQLINQGRREEAKEKLTAMLAEAPKYASALNAMGWCLLYGGDTDSAKPHFERALAVEPLAGGAMNGLARVLYAQEEVDEAIKIWLEMVEEIPGVHAGTAGLAEAYFEQGEFAKAIPFLEQLAEANPNNQQIKDKLDMARKRAAE